MIYGKNSKVDPGDDPGHHHVTYVRPRRPGIPIYLDIGLYRTLSTVRFSEVVDTDTRYGLRLPGSE